MKKSDFEGLMRGLSEAKDYLAGKKVPGIRVHVPERIDVAAVRATTGLTQESFASHIWRLGSHLAQLGAEPAETGRSGARTAGLDSTRPEDRPANAPPRGVIIPPG